MTKISDLSALTGASVDAASDLLTVVDMSLSGAARNKKMTFAELAAFILTNLGDTDGTLAANSDSKFATQKAVKTFVTNAVAGLFDFKGSTDCSANPNYPAASKGDAYVVSVAGKIGGASGVSVDIGDVYIASADNAGGTQASVGTSWFVLEHNGTFGTPYAGGVQSTPVLAAAMTPRTTNGAAAGTTESSSNKVMLVSLDFDQSTIEYAQFMFPMPKSWNESTVTAQFIWTAASGTATHVVIWGIQAVAISDDDPLDASFGTAQEVSDALTATGDVMQSAFTSAMTVGGSPAEGDLVVFQVYRKASDGSDTLAADAKLIGIRLNFTTNAADDS